MVRSRLENLGGWPSIRAKATPGGRLYHFALLFQSVLPAPSHWKGDGEPPASAECGNPWAAQGLPFLSPQANMSPADDPCVYLNDMGDAMESIDWNSNKQECQNNGGKWVPLIPLGSSVSIDPNTDTVRFLLTPDQCNQMNRGLFWLNVGSTIYGMVMGGFWGGGAATIGESAANYKLNQALCGGPGF